MIIVTYTAAADHPFGGPITGCIKVRALDPWGWHAPHVEVPEFRPDWDSTHFVLDSVVAPIPADIVAAREVAMARVRLRVRRDGLLRDVIDPIVTNPLRWEALSEAQKASVMASRDALLAWPDSEPDPMNPTPPALPEV